MRRSLGCTTRSVRRSVSGRSGCGTKSEPDFRSASPPSVRPWPVCGAPVQRIVHAGNETNYCPRCQTGGTLLADRALSRLLKEDWPRRLEELEGGAGGTAVSPLGPL